MLMGWGGRRQEVVEIGDGLVYAVGDIHGRLDLLSQALARIDAHAKGRPATLVFLGDYVDRGPDSRGVVNCLRALQRTRERVICLKGNHEDLMVNGVRRRTLMLGRLVVFAAQLEIGRAHV